jgi:hypothetical protein
MIVYSTLSIRSVSFKNKVSFKHNTTFPILLSRILMGAESILNENVFWAGSWALLPIRKQGQDESAEILHIQYHTVSLRAGLPPLENNSLFGYVFSRNTASMVLAK